MEVIRTSVLPKCWTLSEILKVLFLCLFMHIWTVLLYIKYCMIGFFTVGLRILPEKVGSTGTYNKLAGNWLDF